MTHIDVAWPVLHAEAGRTDGYSMIEIDRRLGQTARRCVVEHERTHVLLGHACQQPEAIERQVRDRVARRLLPLGLLEQALAFTLDLDLASWECWVTRDVMDDRLAMLTGSEHERLMLATAHHRDGVA